MRFERQSHEKGGGGSVHVISAKKKKKKKWRGTPYDRCLPTADDSIAAPRKQRA